MDLRVALHQDPAAVLKIAGAFLESRPVHHNLILSLLHVRLTTAEQGRYWIGDQGGEIKGVVFQSPLHMAALITPMPAECAAQFAEAIANSGVALPGIQGEAAAAAGFAGQWTECARTGAIPFGGIRLYELEQLLPIEPASGALRQGARTDRDLLVDCVRAFQAEVHDDVYDASRAVDRWIRAGLMWLWEDGRAVSMAITREQVAGVTRIGGVFTPPQFRRKGYAAASVHALSKLILHAGGRAILYTDLANATSNSIYRRIGYRAAAEGLRYRFEQPGPAA